MLRQGADCFCGPALTLWALSHVAATVEPLPNLALLRPAERVASPGTAAGLVWTAVGGKVQYIECSCVGAGRGSGPGQLTLTGALRCAALCRAVLCCAVLGSELDGYWVAKHFLCLCSCWMVEFGSRKVSSAASFLMQLCATFACVPVRPPTVQASLATCSKRAPASPCPGCGRTPLRWACLETPPAPPATGTFTSTYPPASGRRQRAAVVG